MIVSRKAMFVALAVLGGAPSYAFADASCTEVFDAGVREVETPHHIYYTSSPGKSGRTFESIFDGTAVYSNASGTWKKSEAAHQTMLEAAHEQRQALDATCTRGASESIDGTSATRWHVKPGEDSGGDESDVWIGPKGLPVHQRMAMPDGGTRDVRIDYANVKAPAS